MCDFLFNLKRWMEGFLKSYVSIWKRAHRKCFLKGMQNLEGDWMDIVFITFKRTWDQISYF